MKNFFARFFRSATHQPLPFKPLATINVQIDAGDTTARPCRAYSGVGATGTSRPSRHTNQLSS